MFELKKLSKGAVPAALDKAVRYRLLNEPVQAESICLDVLQVDPDNRAALKTLLLALTDQFNQRLAEAFEEAQQVVGKLRSDYERSYYQGIVFERRANAHLRRGGLGAGHLAHDWYRRAMECYEQAIELQEPDNNEASLRWNTCVRVMERHDGVCPAPETDFQPLLE